MRVPSTAAVAAATPAARTGVRRLRVDGYELGLLALLGALSMWVVATDIYQAAQHGLVWTRTDGFFIVDQMQYLAWIQSASQHLLVSNLYVLRSTPADYLQPAILISAALLKVGMAPWLTLMLWKPVAVIGIFLAARGAVHHFFTRRIDRRVALTLALLFASLSSVYGSLGVVGDMMPMWLSWGYPFGLIASALIVFALLRYGRARTAGQLAWGPGLLGALASSLHPWQGELLILVLGGAELVRAPETLRLLRGVGGPSGRAWRLRLINPELMLPLVTIALTLAPLLYYLALGHLDINWDMARQASKHAFSFWAIALGAAPLAVFAVLGYRGRPADFFELTMRMWVPAALVIYVLSATALSATPLHAFNAITIPLALLAVKGVRQTGLARIPRARVLVVIAVLFGTIPANVYTLVYSHTYTEPQLNNANFITHDERDALDYLADARAPGGVLSQFYLGDYVPGHTGRHAFVGDCLWSEPRCIPRSEAADALFDGELSRPAARRFVLQTGARFLLASCKTSGVDLRRSLGSLVVSTRRFGCAAVYELTAPPRPSGTFVSAGSRHPA
ncbi:MAG: hypothetical protein ACR2NR_07020 [Solirubrobacteraceae bacterium]